MVLPVSEVAVVAYPTYHHWAFLTLIHLERSTESLLCCHSLLVGPEVVVKPNGYCSNFVLLFTIVIFISADTEEFT